MNLKMILGVMLSISLFIASAQPDVPSMMSDQGKLTKESVIIEISDFSKDQYEVYEGQYLEIEIIAYWDPPNPERPICLWVDPLTLPPGAAVDPDPVSGYGEVSCTLSWTPAFGQAGEYEVVFEAGETCYEPLGSIPIPIIVYSAGTGITFSQVDFVFDSATVYNSDWGRIEVDVAEFATYYGISKGYLNGYTDAGWVLQNVPIDTESGMDYMTMYFNLGVPLGADVTLLSAHLESTIDALVTFGDGTRSDYSVDSVKYNAEGAGLLWTTVIPTPMPLLVFDPLGETWIFIKQNRPGENVQCACNQCFPMSIANSLQYLKNRYGIPIPHNHVKGLKGDNSLVGKLDSDCNRRAPSRKDGDGVWFDDMLEGKFKYLKDNKLANTLIHRHQGRGYGAGALPPGDFTEHGITSKDESVGGKVTFEWICDQIQKCEDVEVVYQKENAAGVIRGGHAVRVFGCAKILGQPFLLYKHDRLQTDDDATDTKGLEEPLAPVADLDGDGMLNFDSPRQEICFALSESPKPPTWTYHFSYDGCPGGSLEVWGTIDCVRIEPLFVGYAVNCETYTGVIPGYINDIIFDFYWDWWCENEDHIKFASPYWNGDLEQWDLEPIGPWIDANVVDTLRLPSIGDPYGEIQTVHYVVDLNEFFANPRPPQDTFDVVDGICDDLPGYLIGTTPITFDSSAGPGENPFSTTRLTGMLYQDGQIDLTPSFAVPCPCGDCNGDGNITFADALYLKNYYYQTPPGSPAPIGQGDVNLDGKVTFGDALYLKNYYYQTPPGSPPPCEPSKAAPFGEKRMER